MGGHYITSPPRQSQESSPRVLGRKRTLTQGQIVSDADAATSEWDSNRMPNGPSFKRRRLNEPSVRFYSNIRREKVLRWNLHVALSRGHYLRKPEEWVYYSEDTPSLPATVKPVNPAIQDEAHQKAQ